jgi:PIN domain nuclease of toxin-antitoxin system
VRLLLDTHAFLWFLLDDPRLRAAAQVVIEDPLNRIEISPASYWEIAIKIRLRKYLLPEPYQIFIRREIAQNGFLILPVEPKHTAANDHVSASQGPVRPTSRRTGQRRADSAGQR